MEQARAKLRNYRIPRIRYSMVRESYVSSPIKRVTNSRELYVFISQFTSAGVALLAAGKVAPSGKERLSVLITAGAWLILGIGSIVTMFVHPRPAGVVLRTVVGFVAEAAGIVAALRYRRG